MRTGWVEALTVTYCEIVDQVGLKALARLIDYRELDFLWGEKGSRSGEVEATIIYLKALCFVCTISKNFAFVAC